MSRPSGRLLLSVFVVTMFLSAYLLFLIQPMMGKIILPWFGGTPAVWNSCMVFFQLVLLAGYFYSFGLTRWVPFRFHPWIHAAVLSAGWFFFPISQAVPEQSNLADSPVFWVVRYLAGSVGWQFFALSTTAPLLQHWFGLTGSEHAKDPYFLYAASNAGSLIGLLGYPLLVEPRLTLSGQTSLFCISYMTLAVLVLSAGIAAWLGRVGDQPAREREATEGGEGSPPLRLPQASVSGPPPDNLWKLRSWWLFCSFVPSSLLLGLTTHLSTNVASFPLLWVIPLALYLVTFILVFSNSRWSETSWAQRAFPYLAILLMPSFYRNEFLPLWLAMPLHLGFFFAAAMVCHGKLASLRPPKNLLTEYYLLMSVGGALGGMFNSFLAPVSFSDVHEYPLAILLACLCLPRRTGEPADEASPAGGPGFHIRKQDLLHPLFLGGGALLVVLGLKTFGVNPNIGVAFFLILVITSGFCFSFQRFPLRFGLGLGVVLGILILIQKIDGTREFVAERNFFGVKRVVLDVGGKFYRLFHGDTIHGCQRVDEPQNPHPLMYYHHSSPIGEILQGFRNRNEPMRIGVIGLGVGCLAAYSWDSSNFTFFEIDPAVDRLARDTRFFTFLSGAKGKWDVVLGDGRLTLAGFPERTFDLMVLDAYSSDAIPVNLLTKEALTLYFSRLTPRGFLAFHISNRHLKLAPLVGKLAAELGATAFQKFDGAFSKEKVAETGCANSHWAVMSKDHPNLDFLKDLKDWQPLGGDAPFPAWTDDFSNILSLF